MPEELTKSPIREQIDYIEKKTRIYDNFRAIREDMFRKVNNNILDTLSAEKGRVTELTKLTASLNVKNDSLDVLLESVRNDLAVVTSSKNKIEVLGLEVNKKAYNGIMWTLIGGLLFIMALGFLIFRRNLVVLNRTEKDLKELKDEFAAYKQFSRQAREKLEMDNFRALQKLKGK
ncbi:MAG TPA: hypothetical protein DCY25_04900 [Bacteroidales bacterium]|jgi:hypothetical protein|nr:hypothetical protein [Bacteroidales bacterium]